MNPKENQERAQVMKILRDAGFSQAQAKSIQRQLSRHEVTVLQDLGIWVLYVAKLFKGFPVKFRIQSSFLWMFT